MNPFNVEKIDWQTNISIRKKKLQMDPLNVEKIDYTNQRQYQREKVANESIEMQRNQTHKPTSVSERKSCK